MVILLVADISAWPYSVGILFRFTSILNTLHWPPGSDDSGHFGFVLSLQHFLVLYIGLLVL